MSLTFGSLFAGIGGFDLGFERAGMKCKWQVEIDEYATRVLKKHWPDVKRWDDVRTFPPKPLGDEWAVDVICGGFPCQDISYAGAGAGLEGEQSGLFFEAIRVVRQLQPRVVVLENVAALLTRGLDRVLGTLAEIGFDAEWHCIPAAAVGAPHIRDRVFIIGQVPNANSEGLEIREGQDASRAGAVCWAQLGRSEWWAVEPDVGRVVARFSNGLDGGLNGYHESCKQTVANRVDRLRGLGNAVVPQVAEFIGQQVVRMLQEKG